MPFAWKFTGLSDVETIYRKRYLNWCSSNRELNACNPLKNHSEIVVIRWSRLPWNSHNEAGCAVAKPFITTTMHKHWHMAPYHDWFHLKRLIVGGWNAISDLEGGCHRQPWIHSIEWVSLRWLPRYHGLNWRHYPTCCESGPWWQLTTKGTKKSKSQVPHMVDAISKRNTGKLTSGKMTLKAVALANEKTCTSWKTLHSSGNNAFLFEEFVEETLTTNFLFTVTQ